jgi:signal transduction histidine kinase
MPLIAKGRVQGVLDIFHRAPLIASPAWRDLLETLASQAAIAIDNARLYEAERQARTAAEAAQAALEAERAMLARRVDERTAELRMANAELLRAARLKDEFLASMSHELRTPLNAILGLSEAVQEEVYGALTAQQRTAIHSIEESGRHLLMLINDILDDSGAMEASTGCLVQL